MMTYSPYVSSVTLADGSEVSINPGSIIFVVGPNNGGKSTFLRDLSTDFGDDDKARLARWIKAIDWELGSADDFKDFISKRYTRSDSSFDLDLRSNKRVLSTFVREFYSHKRLGHPELMIRSLNAESRIQLSIQSPSPDVLNKLQLHPYHAFFYDPGLETLFSKRVEDAFGYELRINRTGPNVIAHLGTGLNSPRLSEEYESHILKEMKQISQFGDGVRSYVGILLNFLVDPRPLTIIDEPEAFLHPPQAFRLGKELAYHSLTSDRQAFVATHSADFIKGALSVDNAKVQFLYLDHSRAQKSITVSSDTVKLFQKEPFLVHTDALDALFYSTAVVCEGDADIMFFKYALDSTLDDIDSVFWISSYGKNAAPDIVRNLKSLGVSAKCVFDIDVLLTPDILYKCCSVLDIDIEPYKTFIQRIPSLIKTPPASDVLNSVSNIVHSLTEDDTDESRVAMVKKVKRAAEGLSKSWSLKATGLRLLPKGDDQTKARELIDFLGDHGIIILKEGEIENYAPEIGGHGRSWVRTVVESGPIEDSMKNSLHQQFKRALKGV